MARKRNRSKPKGDVFVGRLGDGLRVMLSYELMNHPSWVSLLESLASLGPKGEYWLITKSTLDSFSMEFEEFLGMFEMLNFKHEENWSTYEALSDHESQAIAAEEAQSAMEKLAQGNATAEETRRALHSMFGTPVNLDDEEEDDEDDGEDSGDRTLKLIDFLSKDKIPLYASRIKEPINLGGEERRVLLFVISELHIDDDLGSEEVPRLVTRNGAAPKLTWNEEKRKYEVVGEQFGYVIGSDKRIKICDFKIVDPNPEKHSKLFSIGGFELVPVG